MRQAINAAARKIKADVNLQMQSTVTALIAPGKGILAADESFPTIEKRFKAFNISSTENNRRAYREMLFTTPGLSQFISGAILFDETIRQRTKDGIPMSELLAKHGVIPGIKVDKGTTTPTLTGPMTSSKPNAPTDLLPAMLTIGHSTRTLEEFIRLLQAHGATRVVDVRTVPRSWNNPQFNKASLPGSLKKAGLRYVHMPGLGGLRHAKRDSLNIGWRNASFRGYADYMQTPEFPKSLDRLIQLANQYRIALMCDEAVPWRCHRSLIADALLVRGIRTEDIMSPTRRQVHTLTPFAKVCGTTITYPAVDSQSAHTESQRTRSGSQPVKRTRHIKDRQTASWLTTLHPPVSRSG